MPNRRRRSKHARPHRPLGSHHPQAVTRASGEWFVRAIPAGRSEKRYVCPGCDHDISPGIAHVVVWPQEASLGSAAAIDERRHWHTHCWGR
ncbi:hypothetical protein FB460_0053 [Propioniferax innocua]|uniref:ATP/GTP-binding protein n=1 Tax=Propioniferax innocua TaxID=1753 RepID=A0A542ZPJ7_9ACTN|nr:hypothetical protein FB460_0053 [Propioniferax innocua]